MKLKHWIRYLLFKDTTWHGEFRALAPLLRRIKDSAKIVVDIGANDGFYSSNSFPLIRRGWRAVLVEPHPDAFSQAVRRHAGNPRVTVLNVACGDRSGILPLATPDGDHSQSRLGAQIRGGIEQAIPVEVRLLSGILDQYRVPPDFGFLSIDTEGYDYEVILGLNLKRFRPEVIITEKNAHEEAKADYLQSHNYRLQADLWGDRIWMPR
jgi:FkbM family methyltransferase